MEGNRTEGRPGSAGRAWSLFVGLPLMILVAAAVLFAGCGGGAPGSAAEQAERPSGKEAGGEKRAGRPSDGEAAGGKSAGLGHPALGREDAPVVMIEYGDYG